MRAGVPSWENGDETLSEREKPLDVQWPPTLMPQLSRQFPAMLVKQKVRFTAVCIAIVNQQARGTEELTVHGQAAEAFSQPSPAYPQSQ